MWPGQRAVVLDQPLERLPAQVEPVEFGIAPLEPRHHAQRLRVVVEAAPGAHALVESVLAGMAERRVAEIMDQRHRLGEILVAAQRTRQGTRDLRHLDRVGKPRAIVVALIGDEHLRLVFQAAKGRRMDDAVAVALERRTGRAFRLVVKAAARSRRVGSIGRARTVAETDVAEFRTWFAHASRRWLTCPLPLHTYGGNANAR